MFDVVQARQGRPPQGDASQARAGAAIELAWREPLAAFQLFADQNGVSFLYSSGAAGCRSRYSYLCIDPISILHEENGLVIQDGLLADGGNAFDVLQSVLAQGRSIPAPVPFSGGAVGFFGYEMATALENVPRAPGALAGVPDAHFAVYDLLFAWDHQARRVWLLTADDAEAPRVRRTLARWHAPAQAAGNLAPLQWRQIVPVAEHQARVARTLAYIRAGDIYQANITAPFIAPRPAGITAAAIFVALAQANPAPFSAYIGLGGDCAVASVSPERFIQLGADGGIETRPIKGTRKRGATSAEDAAAAAWLLASAKDRAENLMIVDLMRNDLSRVARPGSVDVPVLNALESFASVHHLVSSVRAQLRPGLCAVDVLRAAFPGGSITGAPKIRAMEIIAELEGKSRGAYCGTAAWLGFDGAMDSSILIRTVTVARDCVVAQAGGGIVADSDPASEWDELLVKVMPMLRALGSV